MMMRQLEWKKVQKFVFRVFYCFYDDENNNDDNNNDDNNNDEGCRNEMIQDQKVKKQ